MYNSHSSKSLALHYCVDHVISHDTVLCDLGLAKPAILPMSADLIFHHEHKDTITFHIHNKPRLRSLAAFLNHSNDLYEQFGVQVEVWPASGWL